MPTTHTPTFTRGQTPFWTYPCGCKASALKLDYCPTHAQATAMLIRFRERAEQFHDAKHGTFWPLFGECSVEQCIQDRAILRAMEG